MATLQDQLDKLSAASETFKKLLADKGSETSKFVDTLGDLEEVFLTIGIKAKLLQEVFEAVAKVVGEPLIQAVNEITTAIKGVVELALRPLGLVVKALLTPIRMLAKLIELVSKPFEEIYDLLGRLIEVPLKMFAKTIEMLLAPIRPLIIAFTDLVEYLERMADLIGISYKTMESLMKTGRKALAAAFDEVKKVLTDPLSNLPALMNKIRGMVEAIDPVIVQQFDLAMRDLTALFGRLLRPAFQEIVPLIYKFGQALKPVMDKIAPALAKFIQSIGDFLTRMIPQFVDMLEELIPLAEEYMQTVKKEIAAKSLQLKMYRALERVMLRVIDPIAAMRKDREDEKKAQARAAAAAGGEGGKGGKAGENGNNSIAGLAASQNPTYKAFQDLGREISQRSFVLSNMPIGEKTKDQVQEEFQRKGIGIFDMIAGGWLRDQIEGAAENGRAAAAAAPPEAPGQNNNVNVPG